MYVRYTAWLIVPLAICAIGSTTAMSQEHKGIGMANPASVHCIQQGGTLEIRKDERGESGYCHLPDGRIVEEWELYREQKVGSAPTPSPDAAHNSRNSLDWAGTYRGMLPCADCEGIETVVTLRSDGSYTSSVRYLGKDGEPIIGEGTFEWNAEGSTISIPGDEPVRYQVGENQLIRLALDGSKITGPLADHFVLTKSTEGITEKYWKLIELDGKPVPPLEGEPHLILKAEGGRVIGFGGCNNFTGGYTLDEQTLRISFGQLASTMQACPTGMDVERSFGEMLERVDNYTLDGDHLSLNRARMAPLARFEVVWLR